MLSIALSRTSFGPDPETAKTLARAEMHEEECRLKAFQANLENREKQGQRDHEFRKKKLNHASAMTAGIIVVTTGGVGAGLALITHGNSAVGNPILIASFTLLSSMAGKLLSSREKD